MTRLFAPRRSATPEFEREIMPHLGAAYNLARWLVRDSATADDVVQDAIVRALRAFDGFRGENPRAWLLKIVRNVAMDALDSGRRRATRELPADPFEDPRVADVPDAADDPEMTLSRAQDRNELNRLLMALPADLRECIVLREIEGLSYKEISEITNVAIGTVMSRLWRARQGLLRAARGHGDDRI